MAYTTRWEFNKDKVLKVQTDNLKKHNDSEDDSKLSLYTWVKKKLSTLSNKDFNTKSYSLTNFEYIEKSDTTASIQINTRQINYDYFRFEYIKTSSKLPTDSIEVNQTIIIYEDNNNVFLIIDKNTSALNFLRTIFSFDKKEELKQIKTPVNSDFIVWLIYRVYTNNVKYQLNNKNICINSLIGFKGEVEDNISTVTAKGDKLTNILSTLSFLLENNGLTRISLRLDYTLNANIEITLTTNNLIAVDFSAYKGVYKKAPYDKLSDIHKEAMVLIFVYLEILTTLTNWYSESKEDKEENRDDEENEVLTWDSREHGIFLQKVADDLMKKINEKKKNLKNQA